MIHALASHLWQSTLFAVAAALLTPAFRANKAQVRYCLWLSASVKFLIPFALLTSLGNHIQTWAPSSAHQIATATPALSYTLDRFSRPPVSTGPTAGTRVFHASGPDRYCHYRRVVMRRPVSRTDSTAQVAAHSARCPRQRFGK